MVEEIQEPSYHCHAASHFASHGHAAAASQKRNSLSLTSLEEVVPTGLMLRCQERSLGLHLALWPKKEWLGGSACLGMAKQGGGVGET